MKATSSLERFPQAATSSSALQAERIVHSRRDLDVPEVLRSLIDIVEEVVEPPAQDGGEAIREVPGEGSGQPRRQREKVLRRQLGILGKGPGDVDERDPRAGGDGEGVSEVEVAPERDAAANLAELHRNRRDARELQGGRAA